MQRSHPFGEGRARG